MRILSFAWEAFRLHATFVIRILFNLYCLFAMFSLRIFTVLVGENMSEIWNREELYAEIWEHL